MISVAVVDDHPLYRRALVETIVSRRDTDVVAEFGSAADAVESISTLKPDVCVVAISATEVEPILVLKEICASSSGTRVLMLTEDGRSDRVWTMLEEGASGVVLNTSEADEISAAIVAVANGETYIPARLHRGIAEQIRMRRGDTEIHLTTREIQILCAVADGLSAAEIAADISLAESTVKTHLSRIYDKLGVSERAAAVAEAMRRGLID